MPRRQRRVNHPGDTGRLYRSRATIRAKRKAAHENPTRRYAWMSRTIWRRRVSASSEPLPKTAPVSSPWSPFRHATFSVLWTATVIANIGSWMYSAASGWLMTSLSPEPLVVSMVQVATTLPMFLFALPAGALADIVDKRKYLIVAEIAVTVVSAVFAAMVWLGLANPGNLLLFTFLIGAGSA